MSYAIRNEKQNTMSFLDVQIICEDKKITISVYRKRIFIGVLHILRAFYHLLKSLVLSIHLLIDASGYTQIGLS